MIKRASTLIWAMATFMAGIAAIGLIGFSILSSANLLAGDIKALLGGREDAENLLPASPPASDEVRSYALFTTVEYGAYTVTTGVRYTSSHRPEIDHQWCYIANSERAGQFYSNLTLATASAGGDKTIPEFAASALATLDLTPDSVQALISSHCRFQ